MNYGVEGAYCPLVVFSPFISHRTRCDEEAYQMDVFPTIVELLGYNDYHWKGFGVNLMDSIVRCNRPISEQEASKLSDKLIRNNYFATIEK